MRPHSTRRPRVDRVTRQDLGGGGPWQIIKFATAPAFPGGAAERLVFLALFGHANFESACWPSLATLARETGFGVRRVQLAIAALRAQGLVGWDSRIGRSNRYTLNLDRIEDIALPTHDVPGCEGGGTGSQSLGDIEDSATPTQYVPGSDDEDDEDAPPPTHVVPVPTHQVRTTYARGANEVALGSNSKKKLQEESRAADASAVRSSDQTEVPSLEDVQETIRRAAAALGDDYAQRGRSIAARLPEVGGMATHQALTDLAKKAGVNRSTLGPDAGELVAARPATERRP